MGNPRSRFTLIPTLIVAWFIPGGGFLLHGKIARGMAIFLVLNLTFAIGVLLHGGVIWPAWQPGEPGFNIFNNLTFVFQIGSGAPAIASMIADLLGKGAWMGMPAGAAASPLFDLSSFYLLVSGAMNYFVICNTYDRLYAPPAAAPGEQTASPEARP